MMIFYGSSMNVAQFVSVIIPVFLSDLQSITITKLEKSGDFSVSIVTDTELADIVARTARVYSLLPPNIYFAQSTRDG
jgi:hypothetical protein